ncbi:MAG: glycosyltransferase family 2 protein [Solirubrobacterales bacterium]
MAESQHSRVACLVVSYFSADAVGELLASLPAARGDAELRVSVLDNSCDDAAFAELIAVVAASPLERDAVVLTRNEVNSGYAGGNNRAFAAVADWSPDVVFVINPDVVVTGGSFGEAARRVRAGGDVLWGVPTIAHGDRLTGLGRLAVFTARASVIEVGSNDHGRFHVTHPSGYFLGAAAETWHRAGGLAEELFLFCEEVDLTLRLGVDGAHVRSLDALSAAHSEGVATGSSPIAEEKSLVTYLHGTRSRVILYRSHRALRWYLPAMLTARVLWALALWPRVGRRESAAVLRGLWQGLRAPRGRPAATA